MGGERNTIALFDAIDKQGEYDEKEILKKFKGKYTAKTLSAAKSYLYELVLKSLIMVGASPNNKQHLLDLQKEVVVLHNKALYRQCHKVLLRAKKIALENDMYEDMPFLLRMERTLLAYGIHAYSSVEEGRAVVNDTMRQVLQAMNDYNAAIETQMQLLRIRAESRIELSKENRKKADSLMKAQVFQRPLHTMPFYVALFSLEAQTLYSIICRDSAKIREFLLRTRTLMESDARRLAIHAQKYLTVLYNLGLSYSEAADYEQCYAVVESMRTAPAKWKFAENDNIRRILLDTYTLLGSVILQSQEFHRADEYAAMADTIIRAHATVLFNNSICELLRNVCLLYAISAQENKALFWILRLREHARDLLDGDHLRTQADALFILMHIEAGNDEVAEREIKSLLRKKQGSAQHSAAAFYRLLLRWLHAPDERSKASILRRLSKSIEQQSAQEEQSYWSDTGMIERLWLQYRLSGKSLAEIYRASMQKK